MATLPSYLLYPADIFVDKSPHIVGTVLGSCVAVCLYDPLLKFGVINHYVLPQWNGSDIATMKYGNLSIIRILGELLYHGSKYENIVAKVFGGAEGLTGMPTNFHIGRRNVLIAKEILNEFRIPILVSDVGGNQGKKVTFNTYTGETNCMHIQRRDTLAYANSSNRKDQIGLICRKSDPFGFSPVVNI